MQTVTTIGLDIAKSVFQVHGIDAEGKVVIRRQLKRRYVLAFFQKLAPCLVGIEACASSHHWSRELKGLGHTVRLPTRGRPHMAHGVGSLRRTDSVAIEGIADIRRSLAARRSDANDPERSSPARFVMMHNAVFPTVW
jgi:transposase